MKTDPIQDYILKNKQNFGIAAAVGEGWPAAREKLVSTFLDRLDVRLKRKLKGWKFDRWGGAFFSEPYPSYDLWKPAWEDQYYLSLQCHEYGQRMVFGVAREKELIGRRPFSADLLEAVRKIQASARANSWWEARMTMTVPAADWRAPDVLWQMHKDFKFLESVAEQLLELAKISAPLLDKLVRKRIAKRRRR
jgi:hypothetical protein